MELDGLPLHILLVHVVVVLVPAAALLSIASGVWPAARRRLGIVTPLATLAALVTVPVTTTAGAWLEQRVPSTALIDRHVALGETMLPWSIAVFVLASAQWLWQRMLAGGLPGQAGIGSVLGRRPRTAIGALITVAVVVAAIGSIVTVVLIGEAGSAAVWKDSFSPDPLP